MDELQQLTGVATEASSERRQQVAFLAHALCERVSSRYNLLVAKGIVNENGLIPVFISTDEHAAYSAACRHLTKCFALTEG